MEKKEEVVVIDAKRKEERKEENDKNVGLDLGGTLVGLFPSVVSVSK